MALTRNDAAVHEKTGLYANVRFFEDHDLGLAVNDDIDLRLFMQHWAMGFAVTQETKAGTRHSVQFFDASGTAVHKVFLTRKGDADAYAALVDAYRAEDQSPEQPVEPAPDAEAPRPDAEIDVEGFLEGWAALEDTHDFFPLLREYDVARTQALRLAEGRFAERAAPEALRRTLELAAEREVPIMVFVGNRGCLQIHTGEVRTLRAMGPWYNVLDPGFQLHLNEELVAESWIVRKPTADGIVTSLELYDATGWPIARLFGKRKPGKPELEAWRAVVADVPRA
jgi:putative hemin transport protein